MVVLDSHLIRLGFKPTSEPKLELEYDGRDWIFPTNESDWNLESTGSGEKEVFRPSSISCILVEWIDWLAVSMSDHTNLHKGGNLKVTPWLE